MTDTKQVICIRWGTKYGPDYVNRLYGMIERNISPPFTLTCFTDSFEGIRSEVQLREMPPLPCEMPTGVRGKWPKSTLWSKELGGLSGPVLFVDLDVVITGSLDEFFSFGDPDDVILARNAAKPFQRRGQTSIYRFPVGKLSRLQEIFAADPQGVGEKYRYEQFFVTDQAPGGVKFWPRAWVKHFRIECVPIFPLNFVREPKRPRGAKVIIFAGALNPHDAVAGRWSSKHPTAPSVTQHLAWAWSEARSFKGLRGYVRPTRWVAEAWRE
ncbi:glycosyl transferase [Jannaschia aquimarina]|uniref:Glycosyl transferase n=1 Tax=Jannaschia aquimarina TaxID=935700 RepID=A0A0D1CL03_9RHOB|nr:glycosyl transferase [Jannaschia aquimarina]KIT15467.1 hypothetical protein jaqu_29060 [Jannaschia aquimarina]SNT21925.1 hypothetical protein SAMN05421775_1088 [Jannaschia aquimarina]